MEIKGYRTRTDLDGKTREVEVEEEYSLIEILWVTFVFCFCGLAALGWVAILKSYKV